MDKDKIRKIAEAASRRYAPRRPEPQVETMSFEKETRESALEKLKKAPEKMKEYREAALKQADSLKKAAEKMKEENRDGRPPPIRGWWDFPKPAPKKRKKETKEPKEITVRCLDCTGFEEHFSLGVTYIAELIEEDDDFINVYDRLGNPVECSITRFEMADE